MNLQDMDTGLQTVQQVFKQMHIDKQWSTSFDRGFSWWGYRFAQKIWADAPQDDGPVTIVRVNAETDFLKYPASSGPDMSRLAKIMPLSALNGLVHYRKEGRVKWCCSTFVHPENREWLGMLFSLAAVMQVTEAERTGHGLAQMLEFQPDTGCHPSSGPRRDMDEMLTFEEKVLIPHGANPVEGVDGGTFREVAEILKGQKLLTSYGEDGIAAYVPFGGSEALLVVSSREPHPRLGKGVLFRLFLPPEVIPSDMHINGSLVLDMNTDEAAAWPTGHCLGSWCLGPVGSGRFTPTYVSFMPAFGCTPEVIVNLVFSMLGHNTWAEGYFFAYDRVKQRGTPIKL